MCLFLGDPCKPSFLHLTKQSGLLLADHCSEHVRTSANVCREGGTLSAQQQIWTVEQAQYQLRSTQYIDSKEQLPYASSPSAIKLYWTQWHNTYCQASFDACASQTMRQNTQQHSLGMFQSWVCFLSSLKLDDTIWTCVTLLCIDPKEQLVCYYRKKLCTMTSPVLYLINKLK